MFRSALCGYDLTLQYPQPKHFPTLNAPLPISGSATFSGKYGTKLTKTLATELRKRESEGALLEHGERLRARNVWKRDLAGRANGTIDPWYQCDLYTEMIDYALNFTFPWCMYLFLIPFGCSLQNSSCIATGQEFDYYDIPDALSPEAPTDGSVFLNGAFSSCGLTGWCLCIFFQMPKRVPPSTRRQARIGWKLSPFRSSRVMPLVSNFFLGAYSEFMRFVQS